MKKYSAIILLAALLCTGCTGKEKVSSLPDSETEGSKTTESIQTDIATDPVKDLTQEPETPAAETSEQEQTAPLFKPGTWRGADGYYFFNEDGTSGSSLSFEMGIGVGFDYKADDSGEGNVVFSMGAVDSLINAKISNRSEDSFTIEWDGGITETLVYVSDLSADEFTFYTDQQLQEIALRYYQAKHDYTPGSVGLQSNEDGTVTIQLYDNLGDHNSTSAWYTIDRVTLCGKDDNTGEQVDMSGYAVSPELQ